jgi:hypothetical protein
MYKYLISFIIVLNLSPSLAQEYAATYRVTFVGEWTDKTHPIDYPSGAHFSPLVGHTHDDNGLIWQRNTLASSGVEDMAETGSVITLRNEIIALRGMGFSENYLIGSGIGATGMTSIEFEISQQSKIGS